MIKPTQAMRIAYQVIRLTEDSASPDDPMRESELAARVLDIQLAVSGLIDVPHAMDDVRVIIPHWKHRFLVKRDYPELAPFVEEPPPGFDLLSKRRATLASQIDAIRQYPNEIKSEARPRLRDRLRLELAELIDVPHTMDDEFKLILLDPTDRVVMLTDHPEWEPLLRG